MMLHSAGKAKAVVRSILRRLGETYGGREMEHAAAYTCLPTSRSPAAPTHLLLTVRPSYLPTDLSTYLANGTTPASPIHLLTYPTTFVLTYRLTYLPS